MASSVVQPPRLDPPPRPEVRKDNGTRNPLDRYALWFFVVTLALAFIELGWRLLAL